MMKNVSVDSALEIFWQKSARNYGEGVQERNRCGIPEN